MRYNAQLQTFIEYDQDDIHKPALDGIGYQDSLNWQRAWWDDQYQSNSSRLQPAAGKTVAWINYMTNINKTYGNWIRVLGDKITTEGTQLTRIFEKGKEPYELESGSEL